MRRMVGLVVVLAAMGQTCFGAGASAHDGLHLQFDLRELFTSQNKQNDKDALLRSAPVEPDRQRDAITPGGLNFGSFQAGIGHGLYQFDAKGLGATSIHGDVGRPSTTLNFTFPIH